MSREDVRHNLIRLRDCIREERECAKKMDMDGMARIREEKEALIALLDGIRELAPEDRKYARQIQEENRRNAFLFKSTLNWIQDTMEFFGRTTVPTSYGQYGAPATPTINGRLLSGRI